MIRRPPRSTRTDTLFPYTTLFRSEIVGLIGSNGAGKTTLMNAISGFVPATGGIRLAGDDIRDLPPHLRARRGLGRSFQTALLYPRLTTRECVLLALESQHRTDLVPSLLAPPPAVPTAPRAPPPADPARGILRSEDP